MQSGGKRGEPRRPLWRHTQSPSHDGLENGSSGSGRGVAATTRWHRHHASHTERPLRPPPRIEGRDDAARTGLPQQTITSSARRSDGPESSAQEMVSHTVHARVAEPVYPYTRQRRDQLSLRSQPQAALWPSYSHSTSRLHQTQQQQLHPSGSRDALLHIPVSRWRREAFPAAADATSTSPSSSTAPGRTHRLRDGKVHHCSADDDDDGAALRSAAVMEHYHVSELEAQLQYWRERALRVEGEILQRERSIKEKYAADFAAAQATSEAVIRRLLDKQARLRQQQQRDVADISRTSSASTSSSLSRAIAATPRSHVNAAAGVVKGVHEKEVRALHRRVEELSTANAELAHALAAAKPSLCSAAPTADKTISVLRDSIPPTRDDVADSTSHLSSVDTEKLQSCAAAMGETLLRCLEHVNELRRNCLAALEDNAEGATSASALADDAAVHHRLTHLLASVRHASSVDVFTHHIGTLCHAAESLELLLETCADDVVVLGSRYDETRTAAQLPPPQQQHGALRTIEILKGRLADYEEALTEQTQAGRQRAEAHATELAHERDSLAQELLTITRRASAAEHDAHLHAEEAALLRRRLTEVEEARDAYARECAIQQRRLEVLRQRDTNHARRGSQQQQQHDGDDVDTSSFPKKEAERKIITGAHLSGVAAPAATPTRAAMSPPSWRALPTELSEGQGEVHDASPSPHAVHPLLTKQQWGGLPNGARDMHADATTPRRSLSYSPPNTSEKPWVEKGVKGLGSSASPAAAVSSPVYVVQPSFFGNDESVSASSGGQRCRVGPVIDEGGVMSTASAADTPLARMRAWEEKFKSILTPS